MRRRTAYAALALLLAATTWSGCDSDEPPTPRPKADPTVSVDRAQRTYSPLMSIVSTAIASRVPQPPPRVKDEVIHYDGALESCAYSARLTFPDVVFGTDVAWDDVRSSALAALKPMGYTLSDQLDIPGGYNGFDVTALQLDLSSDESIEALHREVIARAGRCDVLVNNAVTRSALDGWAHDLDAFDRSLRVNASALFKITELFGRNMRAQKSGSIINIGSMMGMVGVEMANYEGTDMTPNPSPIYHYEKGGMLNFTRWAASILGADNVRVNCISPGGLFSNQPEPFVKAYSARTQLGRMADDTDLKGAIVFLASDASVYITGANIPVDGGYTAK